MDGFRDPQGNSVDIVLTPVEARVVGSLIEKQIATPEHYPLSLNALMAACNQKSNRDPIMSLDEASVQETLDALAKKRLVIEKSGFGSRVVKYQHRFCNTQFSDLQLSDQELGIVCVLLLRGPQTPGELRTRTNRLCRFDDVAEVEATLERLIEREAGPLVVRLPREPGKRESRYAHLFSGEVEVLEPAREVGESASSPTLQAQRLDELERLVASLAEKIEQLEERLTRLE
jgi:uncharacterized protein YceH (UPF0502 family)